jgi:hypothetical protein
MLTPLLMVITTLRARLDAAREDDRGMTTEAIIITALLGGVALLVVGWIVTSIQNKGTEIQNDIDGALGLI